MSITKGSGYHASSFEVGEAQCVLLSPNPDPIDSLTSRKRRYAEINDQLQIGRPFAIQAHPQLPSSKAQQLTPITLLPRSCLPLAYLDPTGETGEIGDRLRSRMFSAHFQVLEGNDQKDQPSQPMVLVAQSSADDGLYAVEKVQCGVYALCKLASWVTMKTFEQRTSVHSDLNLPQKGRHSEQLEQSGDHWWHAAVIRPEHDNEVRRNRSSRAEKSCEVRLFLQRPVYKSTPLNLTAEQTPPLMVTLQTENLLETMIDEAPQGPGEIFDMIRSQYLEALYASKISLAYFAKGPLSRARATFQFHNATLYDQPHLVRFLRSSILPLTTMDTKYRESLPSLVRGLPFGTLSDDEGASMISTIGKKARKSKKMNVGKNGLYAGEDVNVARWWIGRDKSSIACDSADSREHATRAILVEQRARETQLQIILVLETLGLEASAKFSIRDPPKDLPKEDGDSHKKSKKAKKPQDLNTLLNLLADRLCIWQSMSIDEAKASSNDSRPATQHEMRLTTENTNNDDLRHFCADVVLPFYGARLPGLTTLLCQKLGGPKQPSPKRPPLTKAESSIAPLKPGTTMQRHQSQKPRRTLERVLTYERSASQRPPPSLSRSATEPVLPRLKREESDTSLSSMPLHGVAMHKRYSQREVDLHAASQAAESKLKKKAKVEKELQSAIAALKRPNPRMAVKELVEDAEKRAADSHSRKSKNPVRNPFAQGVQVMATPSKNRHNDIFASLPRLPRPNAAAAPPELEEIPPSSLFRISDSTQKAGRPSTLFKDNPRVGSVLPTIEQTPTRGPSKLLGRPMSSSTTTLFGLNFVQPSPSAPKMKPPEAAARLPSGYSLPSWPPSTQESPSKGRATYCTDPEGDDSIQATPNKAMLFTKKSTDGSATALLSSSQEQEKSIYASLGWEEDTDDVL